MVSLRCCALVVPVLAVVFAVVASFLGDGRAWDLFPGWKLEDMPDLTGKVAIVTGPTIGGIGHESAIEMARKGAHVILAGRSLAKGQAAVDALLAELPKAKASFMELDLGKLSSVKAFVQAFHAKKLPLHILLNNAGVMANPFTLTVDGLESQFATNHLGHFLLTKLLLPDLEASAPSRIVTVSSVAAFMPEMFHKLPAAIMDASPTIDFEHFGKDYEASYTPFKAYARSKLSNALFASALNRRLLGKKIFSNSCNPGGISTNLQRHVRKGVFGFIASATDRIQDQIVLMPKRGALTQLYLATSPDIETQNIRGRFYQPQALQRAEPAFLLNETLQEQLWEVSDRLVAEFV